LDLFTCCFLSSIDVNKPVDYLKSVERNENLWFGLNIISHWKAIVFVIGFLNTLYNCLQIISKKFFWITKIFHLKNFLLALQILQLLNNESFKQAAFVFAIYLYSR
jgi:hypothetical protein